MGFTSLALHNFRSYSRYATGLSDGVNIVVGPNGSGKTNLLEALYVLSTGTSFRVADRDLIAHGSDWFRLEGVWNEQQRVVTYQLNPGEKPVKQFTIDGAKRARLSHAQRVPTVLFEPDHLRLLTDSPSLRRAYLDGLLNSLKHDFAWVRHQFERTLLQRNNLLKSRLSPAALDDSLFVWDIKFAELAQAVIEYRLELVNDISARLGSVYSNIAKKQSSVSMHYLPSASIADYQTQILKLLGRHRVDDLRRGFTTIGPQRDDFNLILNGQPAETSASRGEVRTLLLSLKIIELEMAAKNSDHSPLLLLDDVFSELDGTRRKALSELAKDHQTLITTTDADDTLGGFFNSYQLIEPAKK